MTTHFTARACRGILVALALAATGMAQAANDYFLKIDGIKGESVDINHRNWIDLESFAWGLTKTPVAGGGAGAGKVSFSDLSWTQFVDASTPDWFLAVATGENIKEVTLDVTRVDPRGVRSESFFQMIFTNTTGTSLTINGSGDGLLANAAMSSGTQVKMRYLITVKGTTGDWVEGTFNIQAGAPTALFSGDQRVLLGLFSAGGNVSFDASAITPVPEPASAALLLGGIGLLALRRRHS